SARIAQILADAADENGVLTGGVLRHREVVALRIEERFMREIFPGEYPRYCAEVPALIPFTKLPRSAPR
ncbi:MAG TPA: hypothetical protein VJ454_01720, partial [Steroidobacteraceae bacterium]|nr:hypothetical protein [Steroidobacteraceae bacterium]